MLWFQAMNPGTFDTGFNLHPPTLDVPEDVFDSPGDDAALQPRAVAAHVEFESQI